MSKSCENGTAYQFKNWWITIDGQDIEANFNGERGYSSSVWIEWDNDIPHIMYDHIGTSPDYVRRELMMRANGEAARNKFG